MKISVLLPVYNERTLLGEALDSLLAQTEPDFEIVAVDDGSTDGTADLLDARARQDSRLRPLHLPHGGIVAALNAGLAVAQGRYIARMDADDVARPDRLRLQAELLDRRPEVGLVAGRVRFLGDAQAQAGMARFVGWTNGLLSAERISCERFVESPFVHPSVMFRRELVEQFGGYRAGDFPEDYELWLRWLEAGVRMEKLDAELLDWRERPQRLTRTDPRYGVEAFFRCKAPYLARRLAEINPQHPRVVVWGAGRVTRLRLRPLFELGIEPSAWIDIDRNKIGWTVQGAPVLGPGDLPQPAETFVLAAVGKRGARELIEPVLRRRGFVVGRTCLFCA
ncbi:MAG: glycosyltransferase [Acidobacteria bacterium]|nr:glycosyltransferase [Acidobacteriota bacterium]